MTEKLVFDKKAAQIYASERATIGVHKARVRKHKFAAKPAPSKTNFSVTFGISHG